MGCGKVGAIAIPSTPMLKANDIEYRIQKSESKAIISTSMNVEEIEKIKNCQTLEHKIIVHDKIDNWYSFEEICNKSNMFFDRDIVACNKYFLHKRKLKNIF